MGTLDVALQVAAVVAFERLKLFHLRFEGDTTLLEFGNDAAAIGFRQIAEKHAIGGFVGPEKDSDDECDHCRSSQQQGYQRILAQAFAQAGEAGMPPSGVPPSELGDVVAEPVSVAGRAVA